MNPGQDHAADASPANQPVVPAEIVIQHQVEGFRLARHQGQPRAILDFRFEAAAAHRPGDPAIGVKKRLRPDLLRARSLGFRDDPERDRFFRFRRGGQGLVKRGHGLDYCVGG